jgi:hypothetical protein
VTAPDEPLVFGVKAGALVDALRGAGMADADVVTVVGQAIARSAGLVPDDASGGFVFQTHVSQTASECELNYRRSFVHPDFIDGVTVVQAGETPDEMGFNLRFHNIEAEFDAISHDLAVASNCTAELRRELFGVVQELQAKITEIDQRLDTKGKESKEAKDKDTKEGKDKDTKEGKDKETKEGKDKEGKDTKEGKDGKETKENKDGKEHKDGKERIDKISQAEKQFDTPLVGPGGTPEPPTAAVPDPASAGPAAPGDAGPESPAGTERTFIRLEDRPPVGQQALSDDPAAPEPAPTGGGG